MNINITTFANPFSFFYVNENNSENIKFNVSEHHDDVEQKNLTNKSKFLDVNHGQYVAVMWKNMWARGVVSMESRFLIWLIDYGIFLKPNDYEVFIDLPMEFRKLPTKIIEASIHGVIPLDKVLNDFCQIENAITKTWTLSSIEKCKQIIKDARKVYFQPIALLSSPHNDVVLGDLYVELQGKGYVNIIEELESWPVFAERNNEAYIKNFSNLYTTRRRHRLCTLKPELPNTLPTVNMQLNLAKYLTIIANAPKMETLQDDLYSEAGSTVLDFKSKKDNSEFKVTADDMEKYSGMYITIHGQEYNMLNILVNKVRDMKICKRYQNHDLKSIGRGWSYKPSYCNE